jgi:hypothetical protein
MIKIKIESHIDNLTLENLIPFSQGKLFFG